MFNICSVKMLDKASSMSLDMEAVHTGYYLTKLCGSWARERSVVETKLDQGTHLISSSNGVSSHEYQPFVG